MVIYAQQELSRRDQLTAVNRLLDGEAWSQP